MSNKNKLPRALVWQSVANFFAFGFGVGLIPRAPGTFGSMLALPLFIYLINPLPYLLQIALIAAGFVAGICWCARAALSIGNHDHPAIVWDEVVGMCCCLYLIPLSPLAILLALVLFRAFDILKPWPLNIIDRRVGGGLGIMLDDAIAGVATNIILHLIIFAGLL